MTKHTTATATKPSNALTYVGLDVHKETIAVAVAEVGKTDAQVLGIIPNDETALRTLMRKLGPPARLRVCYEAGPCGYVIHRFLQRLKIDCVVVAPSLIPRKPGDRIKTDRRDARKLAVLFRNGLLTPTWIPDREHEALRDLVRAREDGVTDLLRTRQRLGKFLLRLGARAPEGASAGSARYRQWLAQLSWELPAQQIVFTEYCQALEEVGQRLVRLEGEIETLTTTSAHAATIAALQAMRGVGPITAMTIVAELGDISRFRSPRQLMAYAGLVPSEHSSGQSVHRGSITKTGNAHLRRVMIESAWHCRLKPAVSKELQKRRREAPAAACAIAWKAQQRLYKRYHRLVAKGKPPHKATVAVARELLGFIWAIAHVAPVSAQPQQAAA